MIEELEQISLHNVAEVVPLKGGWQFYRLPRVLLQQLNENAQQHATWSSSSELRFNFIGEQVVFRMRATDKPTLMELYRGALFSSDYIVDTTSTEVVIPRIQRLALYSSFRKGYTSAFDTSLCRLVLPWDAQITLESVEGHVFPSRVDQVPRQTYLAYGSSITQGYLSVRPTGTFAALLAHQLDVNLVNLGLGGGACFEAPLADYIAQRKDWHFATIEAGINMVEWCSVDEFEARLRYFLHTIHRAHPDKRLYCIDMFPYFHDYDPAETRNDSFRRVVREVVAEMASQNVVYINAYSLLSTVNGLASDLLHPSPAGMIRIAQELHRIMTG